MLANAPVRATLPATDLEQAKHFYGATLGLTEAAVGVEGGDFFEGGGGTMLRVYERAPGQQTAPQPTVAAFLVDDLDEEMSELRRTGVSFEEYDLPRI